MVARLGIFVIAAAFALGAPRGRPAPPHYDAGEVNNPATRDMLSPGDKSSAVVRAQILLSRAHFSVGEIDGYMGANTLEALAGFEQARGLAATNYIDDDVWNALDQDQAPALIPYTIMHEDLAGPFVPVPANMLAKARLKYLGFSSPIEELAEKFHVAPAILQALNPRCTFRKPLEQILVPNNAAPLQAQAAQVIVSKSHSTVTALDDSGNVIAQYPCTTGSEHDPLPIGYWVVTGVYRDPHFNYNPNLFWDAQDKNARARIAPGPNNPVGLVWIDLSKPHYGIHGTPDPQNIGHTQSHGCIRLTNWDALELAGMAGKGTPAILRD